MSESPLPKKDSRAPSKPGAHQRAILVTGGAGFIGSALVRALLDPSPLTRDIGQVIVLDALTYAGHLENLEGLDTDPRFAFQHGDIADQKIVDELFRQYDFDVVFHLAAESHVDRSIADAAPFVRTNVTGSFVIADSALRAWSNAPRKRRLIHVSTDEVYGALGEQGVFKEDAPLSPTSPYAASKAAADLLLSAYVKTYGLPAILTRSVNNYGPRQLPEKLIPLSIVCAMRKEPLPLYGDGKQRRQWLHVDDHVRGLLLALEHGKIGQTYHFGSTTELTNRETMERVAGLVDQTMDRPEGTSEKLITSVADRPAHDFRYALSSERTCREIQYVPKVDFLHGLKRTVEWYIGHAAWVDAVAPRTSERGESGDG